MKKEQAEVLMQWNPLVQAIADGKIVQRRNAVEEPWSDWCLERHIDLIKPPDPLLYRIKPEPREFWLCSIHGAKDDTLLREPTKTEIERRGYYEIIHVREVLPE